MNQEYGTGDYSLIEAFLVGHDFGEKSLRAYASAAERKFTIGRPARPEEWHNLKFIEYRVDEPERIAFSEVSFGSFDA